MAIEKIINDVHEACDDFATYTLKKPVTNIDGKTYKSVKVKVDFIGADLEAIGNAGSKEGTAMITIVSHAIDLPVAVVRTMSGKDVRAIAKMVQGFLADGES